MNIGGLLGALTPVFFVLALGYLAGKRNAFDADQSAGLSKLALTFALPASLFVSMTEIPKDLLLQQGRLVLALILSHAGLFVVAWVLLRMVKSLSGTASIIYALMLATSATPVFGLAVLEPLLGRTSGGGRGTRRPGDQFNGTSGSDPSRNGCSGKRFESCRGPCEAKRHRNRLECWLEIATPVGTNPWNCCRASEHSSAGSGRQLFRVDWLRHIRGSSFCGWPRFGGSLSSLFTCRIGRFPCSCNRAIGGSVRSVAFVARC
jgi:hypothetical protein